MIPFERTWPYETLRGSVYVSECPFCRKANVTLPLRVDELPLIQDGRKRRLVFPCCHGALTVVDADRDYLLVDRALRRSP